MNFIQNYEKIVEIPRLFLYLCRMNPYKPIRAVRIAVSLLSAALIVASLLAGQMWLLSRMQFGIALVAGAGMWVAVWVAVTALFGRIYCSTLCPLGTTMDLVRWLRPRRRRYSYHPASNRLRYTLMVFCLVAAALGMGVVVALLEPYSIFARSVNLAGRSLLASGIIVITLAAVGAMAYRRGRLWCNTVCPVGSMLSLISRWSTYHVDINTDLCVQCGRCTAVCPAECIDLKDHVVDSSRCVVCMDCLTDCPNNAITYRRGRHQLVLPMMQRVGAKPAMGMDRRAFLSAIAVGGVGVLAAAATKSGQLKPDSVPVPGMKPLKPFTPIMPPGFDSPNEFLRQCTACGACVQACPTGVLCPSQKEYGLRHALVPMKDYDRAYCSYDCVKCTTVCPTGALNPLSVREKHEFVVGAARVAIDHCIVYSLGERCGECVRCCPRQAVQMMPAGNDRYAPLVDVEACIGCGECQYRCPAEPRAIVVEGM